MNGSNEKIFNLLTIGRKAGRIVMGFDSVKDAVINRKAKLVLLAADISAKTAKETRFFADKHNIPVIQLSVQISDFEFGIGKKVGVVGICDEGFAKKMTELTE